MPLLSYGPESDLAEPSASSSHVPVRLSSLVITEDAGGFAISNPHTGSIVLTNKLGARILDLIDGNRDLKTICEILQTTYPEVGMSILYDRVCRFVSSAVKKRLVRFQPSLKSGHQLVTLGEQQAITPDTSREEESRKYRPDIYWYLTFRCNLACTHCSVLSSPSVDNSTDLNTNDCLQVVDQISEMNVGFAMLSGGEVLIRPDALKILRALGERNIYVGLETNGLKIGDPSFIDLALEMQARNLMIITVSLDGGTPESHAMLRGKGSFERTVQGMRKLHAHGVKFDIQCVVHRGNYRTIPDLYGLAAELQPEKLLWLPLNSAGRGSELVGNLGLGYSETVEILDLIHANKRRHNFMNIVKVPPAMVPPHYMIEMFKGRDVGCCTSCKFPLLGILPNGDITVCGVSRNDPSLYFGNVREIRLKDAWMKAKMDLLRDDYSSALKLEGICGDCVWKYACKGSCRAKAYEEGGDFFSPFPVCKEAADRGEFPDYYRISKGGRVAA